MMSCRRISPTNNGVKDVTTVRNCSGKGETLMSFFRRTRILLVRFMLVSFGIIGSLVAQTDRGTITGTVTDPSGAVIVGAIVTATNTATRVSAETTTTTSGKYTIPALSV